MPEAFRVQKEIKRYPPTEHFICSQRLHAASRSCERTVATRTVLCDYAKRWGIETSFRDIEDVRFAMRMWAIRISKPERRDRMWLLSALAITLPTLLGAAGEHLGHERWLKADTAKHRTHSLFRQGLMLYQHTPAWPEHRLCPLLETFARMWMEQRMYPSVAEKISRTACSARDSWSFRPHVA